MKETKNQENEVLAELFSLALPYSIVSSGNRNSMEILIKITI